MAKTGGKCISLIVLVLLIVVTGGTMYWKPPKPLPATGSREVIHPYRAVTDKNKAEELFPYVLHKRESDNDHYWQYSAVIKTIDPAHDDYKTYCRNVISDILKTAGSKRVAVNVFDDEDAYRLSELKAAQDYKALTDEEMDSVRKHTIAVYTGDLYGGDESHRLTFCTAADSGYASREVYLPEP